MDRTVPRVFRAMSNAVSLPQKISLWISSKSKRSDRFALSQKNIYIFPSKAGFGFLALLALMLVTAINYQSSLVYMLTFLLGSVFFVSIWLCFLNLRGLMIEKGEQCGAYSGEDGEFEIKLMHPSNHVLGLEVAACERSSEPVDIEAGKVKAIKVAVPALARGWYQLDRLRIETFYPFGLIRGWTWLKLNVDCVVYPAPKEPPSEAEIGEGSDGSLQHAKGGDKDLLRGFQTGDSMAHVHWKKFASSDQLVVREQGFVQPKPGWLRWEDFPEASTEQRLSYLCFKVLQYQREEREFGLLLPGGRIEQGGGDRHAEKCLRALAGHGLQEPVSIEFGDFDD